MHKPMFGNLEVEIGPFNLASTKTLQGIKVLLRVLQDLTIGTQLFRLSK